MSTSSMKLSGLMAHLHLGCGESLSQLLPTPEEKAKPPARARRLGMSRTLCKKPRNPGERR